MDKLLNEKELDDKFNAFQSELLELLERHNIHAFVSGVNFEGGGSMMHGFASGCSSCAEHMAEDMIQNMPREIDKALQPVTVH